MTLSLKNSNYTKVFLFYLAYPYPTPVGYQSVKKKILDTRNYQKLIIM